MKNDVKMFDGYRIVRPRIAKGGSGTVHEATAPDGARVAIKVLNRTVIEARIGARLAEHSPFASTHIIDIIKEFAWRSIGA